MRHLRSDDSDAHPDRPSAFRSAATLDRSTSVTGTCVVCDAPVGPSAGCCSLRCAAQAQQELERNVARVRRLRRAQAGDHLHRLMSRNGQLSQALMRWRSPLPG